MFVPGVILGTTARHRHLLASVLAGRDTFEAWVQPGGDADLGEGAVACDGELVDVAGAAALGVEEASVTRADEVDCPGLG